MQQKRRKWNKRQWRGGRKLKTWRKPKRGVRSKKEEEEEEGKEESGAAEECGGVTSAPGHHLGCTHCTETCIAHYAHSTLLCNLQLCLNLPLLSLVAPVELAPQCTLLTALLWSSEQNCSHRRIPCSADYTSHHDLDAVLSFTISSETNCWKPPDLQISSDTSTCPNFS